MSKQTEQKKTYNKTVAALFQTGSGNFMSRELEMDKIQEAREALETMKEGESLFLKKGPLNSSGKHTYFLEIVNPKNFKKPTQAANDDL